VNQLEYLTDTNPLSAGDGWEIGIVRSETQSGNSRPANCQSGFQIQWTATLFDPKFVAAVGCARQRADIFRHELRRRGARHAHEFVEQILSRADPRTLAPNARTLPFASSQKKQKQTPHSKTTSDGTVRMATLECFFQCSTIIVSCLGSLCARCHPHSRPCSARRSQSCR